MKCAWTRPALADGDVFVDVHSTSRLSLKDALKPIIDGLEAVLGRDPQGRLEFCPRDDRIAWLRTQRVAEDAPALRVRVGILVGVGPGDP